jgi:hypothetical protein
VFVEYAMMFSPRRSLAAKPSQYAAKQCNLGRYVILVSVALGRH